MKKSGYLVLIPASVVMLALLVYCDLLLISRDAGATRGLSGYETVAGGAGNGNDAVTEAVGLKKGGIGNIAAAGSTPGGNRSQPSKTGMAAGYFHTGEHFGPGEENGGVPVIDADAGDMGFRPAGDEGTPAGQEKAPQEGEETLQTGREVMPVIREEVPVDGNTPEYDLKMELCEDDEGKTFLRIEYYKNGACTVGEIWEDRVPELSGLLEKGKVNGGASGGTAKSRGIGQVLLNPVHGQLYLLIYGEAAGDSAQATLYMAELDGMQVEKLFSRPGLCGVISCSGDFGMIAYDFRDSRDMDVFRENCSVEVFDCKTGEYLVKGSRDAAGRCIGSNAGRDCLYDYEFTGWNRGGVMRLRRAAISENGRNAVSEGGRAAVSEGAGNAGMQWEDVLYDVRKNIVAVADAQGLPGTGDLAEEGEGAGVSLQDAAHGVGPQGATDGSGVQGAAYDGNNACISADAENGPASSIYYTSAGNGADAGLSEENGAMTGAGPEQALRHFYSSLASEDYAGAIALLDDGFRLRLDMLEHLGVDEITRSDIDAEYEAGDASLYGKFLKGAEIDAVIDSRTAENGTAIIKYYQKMELSPDSQVRQLLAATLANAGKGWKIILIEDGNE